jgi:hypothetical protein
MARSKPVPRGMSPDVRVGDAPMVSKYQPRRTKRMNKMLSHATGKSGAAFMTAIMDGVLGSGPIKTLSKEEIAELENQYTMKSE